MRNVPAIWEAWKSGGQIGEQRPSTRVTVEKSWYLNTTGATVGTWTRGPAHWYQREDLSKQDETELPGVLSVAISRSLETDAGTCDITIMNSTMPVYGQPETPTGQFTPGALTFDHGVAQEARARWSHTVNSWQGVLVPNALLRTYQGYGGHDKAIRDAVADGNIILNGVWLVDDVQITSEGNISLKCRDMMKLLIDQWLFPPLVPANLYPPKYERYHMVSKGIPKELPPPWGNGCYPCSYFNSSTDGYYGEWNTHATGHPGSDAFDISNEPRPKFAHQATFWLSEPYGDPYGTPWIEFLVDGNEPRPINQIYFHVFEGKLMGWPPEGIYQVMVSVVERGVWAAPDMPGGGVTPQGIPYVSTFVPATDWNSTNEFMLPRIYWGTLIRLTVTNLQPTWEGGWRPPGGPGDPDWPWPRDAEPRIGDGGYRAGARKIMACLHVGPEDLNPSNLSVTGVAIPANNEDRRGYWQVRVTGQIYAFGDARIHPCTSPRNAPKQGVVSMDVHPSGKGYWVLDDTGIVLSYGDAQFHGDLSDWPYDHSIGMARTPSGNGYWILERDGAVHAYGDAPDYGRSIHSNIMVSGAPAMAEAICAHPTLPGYWVLWTDGYVDSFGVPFYGHAPQENLFGYEFYTSIRSTDNGEGYWILRALGGIEARGNAPFKGHATRTDARWSGAKWYYGVAWEIVNTSTPGNGGYMVQRADGSLEPVGDVNDGHRFGSIGEGVQWERSPGNYKDYCLDDQSQALTPDGWKSHDELQEGDLLLGFDPESGDACWQPVESVYRRTCTNREMVRMRGTSFDALTTPDHRWLVKAGKEGPWRWTTSDALRTTDLIPMSIPNRGVHVPAAPIHKDEFVELVAWFWTEGWWTSHSGNLAQSITKNPHHVQRIRATLRALYGEPGKIARGRSRGIGAMWREKVRDDGVITFVLTKPIGDRLRQVVDQQKAVSWTFLRELTLEQLDRFIEVSIDADGWRPSDGRGAGLAQGNLQRLEAFEFACILAGRPITRKKTPKRDSWSVHLHKCGYQAPVRSAVKQGRMTITRDRYTGTVWCPTVEHGNFVARRGGSIYVTGNSDIVKELLLWAGFYLKPEVQAATKFPNVYGSIESTGAWADDPLPEAMFEKRPVYDAIRDLRDIVGYLFYVDPEGAVHFESPSWWALGNWLTNVTADTRVPFGTMPEIDENVQLQKHSIGYSGQSAYSEIILATEDPMPREAGKPVSGNITQTRLVPKTAPDLRGMTHLYMRTHDKLSNIKEQKVMADLIDMKMWFSRRLGEIVCAANPLIDIDDQVRVIERTTGEVYIHYVRGININHDLDSGDFTMTLTTHWLGGGPWEKLTLFYTGATRPQSDGYWTVTIGGTLRNDMRSGIYPSGRAELYNRHEADSHTDDVIAMRATATGLGFYTMDRTGKILTYGDAVNHGRIYRPRVGATEPPMRDLALTPSGGGYWVLDKNGTVTAFGDATHQGNADISGKLPDGTDNYATSIEAHPAGGYWTLTANGTVAAHGTAHLGNGDILATTDRYVAIRHTYDGGGYWLLSNEGIVSNHGNAPHYGNGTRYPDDQRDYGLTWDMLTYDDNSYALLHADGSLEGFGAFTLYSPIVRYDTKYWALVPTERAAAMTDQTGIFPLSGDIIAFLKKTGSPAAANAIASDFGNPPDAQRVGT